MQLFLLSIQFAESIYNVPRVQSQHMGDELYDTPRASVGSAMSADAAINAGIYHVPRTLMHEPLEETGERKISVESQYLLGANPLSMFSSPRASMSPDEEGIYDHPFDIIDMEIYDYPPDAAELGIYDSDYDRRNSSVSATSSELPWSEAGQKEPVPASSVPPVPSSARPAMMCTVAPNTEVGTE